MNRKNLSIIIFFLIFAITGPLASKMSITNVPNTYVPKTLPSRVLNDDIRDKFGTDELMLIIFKDDAEEGVQKYQKYKSFFENIKTIKGVKSVTSLFNFEHIKSNEDGFEVADILDLEKFAEFEANLKRDENVRDFLINNEKNYLAMVLEPLKIDASVERLELENKVLEEIDKANLKDTFFGLGGQFVIDTAQFREMMTMMKKTIPLTLVVGIIVLYLLFSNIKFVLLTMMCNGAVTQFCLSMFVLFGWPYNMVSSMIPSLMSALTIAFMVHLLNAIKTNRGHEDVIMYSLKKVRKPSLYSAITTAVGLFALYSSPIPPVGHIGVIGGLGVLFSYVIVFEISPYLMLFFKNKELKGFEFVDSLFEKINNWFIEKTKSNYKYICFFSVVTLLVMIPPIYKVESESNLLKFFDDDHVVNVVNRKFQDKFVGTTSVDIVMKKSDVGNLLDSQFLKDIYDMQKELEKHPNVTRAFSHVDVVKQLHMAFNNDQPDNVIPIDNLLIDQYVLIYDGDDMYDFIERNLETMRINLALNVQGANEIEKVIADVTNTLSKYKYKYDYAGFGKVMSDQENLLISGVLKSLGYSLLIIFVLLVLLWRSAVDAILSMIPNISPVLAGFAFMGILGIWLDFGTAMIASITVGIAVDDTIHMYHSIKSKIIDGVDIDTAISESYKTSGTAILMTTLILCSQFSLLLLTSFTPLKNFGFLTSIGLVFALFYDLTFLPSFMKLIYEKSPRLLGVKEVRA